VPSSAKGARLQIMDLYVEYVVFHMKRNRGAIAKQHAILHFSFADPLTTQNIRTARGEEATD